MAQAARLNLRMQKELKLLLTDPPPGVSLPMLSSSSSSDDISLIHAQIRGPEGTVYANGVFTIKIQIPDRYPFQPPNVTFATPIYHPNIDNGGRICLDILNLPPKGAWQPSLNVSTVLTSIGLLLSEPNPDDGLMCDVSREYKYNRQIFDQRAQSMTEKYAKATINGSTSSAGSTPVNPNLSMIKTEGFNLGSVDADTENKGNQKKLTGVSRKLSLESTENNGNQKKLTGVSKNLSLEPLGSSQGRNNHEESNKGGNLLVDVCGGQLPHQYHVDKHGNNCKNVSTGKPHDSKCKLVSSNSSSSTHSDVEEILVQTPSSLSDSRTLSMISSKSGAAADGNQVNRHPYKVCEGNANNSCVNLSDKKQPGISQKLSIRSWHSPQNENVEEKDSALQPASKHERQQLQPVNKKKAENSTKKTMSKVLGISKKVSVNVSDVSKTWDGDDDKENVPPNYQVIPKSLSLRMPQAGNYDRQQSHPDNCLQAGNGSSNKKFCGLCRKLSLGSSGTSKTSDVVDVGNVLPIQKSLPHSQSLHTVSSTSMSMPHNGNQPNQEVCIGKDNIQKPEDDPSISEDIIVLDSEDSEEEAKGPPMKSRLSLSRRCLAGKRKDKA